MLKAGIPYSMWNLVDKTAEVGGYILKERIVNNNLTEGGIDYVIRQDYAEAIGIDGGLAID